MHAHPADLVKRHARPAFLRCRFVLSNAFRDIASGVTARTVYLPVRNSRLGPEGTGIKMLVILSACLKRTYIGTEPTVLELRFEDRSVE